MTKYPTKWSYGIPRGSKKELKTKTLEIIGFSLTFSRGTGKKQLRFRYEISEFSSRKKCEAHVDKMKIQISHELGLTRNEVRFIDEKTIEIKLTNNKTFITDAKNLDIVNKYPLQAKPKKEKNISRFYVIAQDKKKTFKFTNLLNNYKFVEYINGNTLDLRECNMKEFGLGFYTAETNDEIGDMMMENHAVNYFWDEENLPKNEWILGSIPGTIFPRGSEKGKILTLRIKDNTGKERTKTFNIKNYDSEVDMWIEATIFLINIAHKFNFIQNPIRINDSYLEIMIEEDIIMKTDLIFLPLFMIEFNKLVCDATICETKSATGNKIYAAINLKSMGKIGTIMNFHKFIMGSPFIDHINGDTLDNRLENLRFSDYENNNHNQISYTDLAVGVVYNKIDKYYTAFIRTWGRKYKKNFYVNIYGRNKAKELANSFRKDVLEVNFTLGNIDDMEFTNKDLPAIQNSLERTKVYQKDLLERIVLKPKDYLFGYDYIDFDTKKEMHAYYLKIQSDRFIALDKRIKKLEKIANALVPKKNHKYVEV